MEGRSVSLQELRRYLERHRGDRKVVEVVLHHTSEPRAASYSGLQSWQRIRRWHMHGRGFIDIGYHIGVGVDGSIWLLRPVSMHGAHCRNHNSHSVGVVMFGDYNVGRDDLSRVWPTTKRVLATILSVYGLPITRLHFHKEFKQTDCPGTQLTLEWARSEVQSVLAGGEQSELHVILQPSGKQLQCAPRVQNGVTWCDAAPVLRVLVEDSDALARWQALLTCSSDGRVPLRPLVELLGWDVHFDAPSKTILLSPPVRDVSGSAIDQSVEASDMQSEDRSTRWLAWLFMMVGAPEVRKQVVRIVERQDWLLKVMTESERRRLAEQLADALIQELAGHLRSAVGADNWADDVARHAEPDEEVEVVWSDDLDDDVDDDYDEVDEAAQSMQRMLQRSDTIAPEDAGVRGIDRTPGWGEGEDADADEENAPPPEG